MGVINVKEDDSVRSPSIEATSERAMRRFTVLLDATATHTDRGIEARQATGIPRRGDGHPDHSWMIAARISATNLGNSRCAFEIVVDYETPTYPGGTGGGGESGNPLDEAADIQWTSATSIEPVDVDADGNPLVNSADEGFDPPLTEEIDDELLTITRNEATFTADTIRTYQKTVNSLEFFGSDPGTARMNHISAQRIIVGNTVAFWRVTYVIQFRQDNGSGDSSKAWYRRVLDQGFRELLAAQTGDTIKRYRKFVDDDGVELVTPRYLDGAGAPLETGDPHVWLQFKLYDSVDWTPLGLE